MTHAVANIVAINATMPAEIGFGVHWYSILEPNTPTKTAICKSFTGASYAV